jgi:UDP-N-acetylglucosamine--N-acetylmuramyl-(pentapeptide) pyrophosphoryl-undecaprenol N-acetylglucosamine transferase
MKQKKVIISGGGTAGHIYPALAVGNKLKEKDPHLQLTHVGTHRELEKNIMEHHKVDFIPLKIEGLKGKGLKIVKSLFLLPFSFIKSFAILRRIKPDLVIGVGGYSSGPVVLLASWMKIPTLILEQNFRPGFTNRMLVRWVRKAVVAFKGSLPYFKGKGIFIGNPVREEFCHLSPKARNEKLTIQRDIRFSFSVEGRKREPQNLPSNRRNRSRMGQRELCPE